MTSNTPHVVIIGGGFGGLSAARALNRAPVRITLVDRTNHHLFQPLLYQVAMAGLSPADIAEPIRSVLRRQKNVTVLLAEAVGVDFDQRIVQLADGSLPYDYLMLATGGRTSYFGHENWEQFAPGLKDLDDAVEIRRRVLLAFEAAEKEIDEERRQQLLTFVVVGGGPTGVELAGALSELKKNAFPKDYKELDMRAMDIHLIEASPRLLNGMSAQASAKALEFLSQMGVQVRLNTAVKAYDGYEVLLSGGEKIISRSVIWTAGVRGNPIGGLSPELINKGNRLLVDQFNRVKSFNHIFAIGDVALMEGDEHFPNGHPQMAPPAQQQGRLLADNIKNLISNRPLKPFHYHDKGSMATIGRNKAVVDMKGGARFQGAFAWYVWMFVHLMSMVGFRNKVFTFLSWMWNYFSFDRSNRLIIGRNEERLSPEEVKPEEEKLEELK